MRGQSVRRAVLASDHDALRFAISLIKELNQIDERSMTPLLYAIYGGDVESCRILLEAGADPNSNPTPSDPTHTQPPFERRKSAVVSSSGFASTTLNPPRTQRN